jgi:hypothetical protein
MTIGTSIFLSILTICITILLLRLSKELSDYLYRKRIRKCLKNTSE